MTQGKWPASLDKDGDGRLSFKEMTALAEHHAKRAIVPKVHMKDTGEKSGELRGFATHVIGTVSPGTRV